MPSEHSPRTGGCLLQSSKASSIFFDRFISDSHVIRLSLFAGHLCESLDLGLELGIRLALDLVFEVGIDLVLQMGQRLVSRLALCLGVHAHATSHSVATTHSIAASHSHAASHH